MEEQTTTITADIFIDAPSGFVTGTVSWEESTAVLQQLHIVSEQNTQMQATLDNIFFALLFLVGVVGIRVGQAFVQIFKTR